MLTPSAAGVTQDQCGYILAASTYTTTGADGKPTSGGASSGSSSKKLSGGAIAGIVVGVVGGLLIVSILFTAHKHSHRALMT